MRTRILLGIIAIVPAVCWLSCSSKNAGAGREPILEMNQDLVIPGPASGKNVLLASIRSVQIDGQGDLFVLDVKDGKVKVFDKDGRFLREFGRKGSGPGEFQSPVAMFMASDALSIFDFGTKRLLRYALGGRYIDAVSLNELGSLFRPDGVDENTVYGNVVEPAPDGRDLLKLVAFDWRAKRTSVISQYRTATAYPSLDPLTSTFVLGVRKDGVMAWALQKDYAVSLVSRQGNAIGRITRAYAPRKVTDEEKDAVIKAQFGGKSGIPPDVKLIWPEYHPPIESLIVGDSGWLYAQTSERDARGWTRYDAFDADLAFRGCFFCDKSVRLIRNRKAYATAEDAGGYPVVIRYRMESPGN